MDDMTPEQIRFLFVAKQAASVGELGLRCAFADATLVNPWVIELEATTVDDAYFAAIAAVTDVYRAYSTLEELGAISTEAEVWLAAYSAAYTFLTNATCLLAGLDEGENDE